MATDRIRTRRDVNAMVAFDTFDLIEQRVRNLLSHGRHITTVSHLTNLTNLFRTPEVVVGLLPDGEPERRDRIDMLSFSVTLGPGLLHGFGFSAHTGDGCETEKEARTRFCANDREDLTEIRIVGGLTGDGPAGDDQLVIRHWNSAGVCRETVIGFDNRTGPVAERLRAEDLGLKATR